ncbi:MAG: Lrp/AsnC family transcriptional regulator [Methanobacteriaceae archaeon]|nr:Lrp/AsnC family transcriptional regulator [Methanobacteriaceae archaeon]
MANQHKNNIKNTKESVYMDELDKSILKLLSDDGRKSYRKISRELGVSVGTIHNRVDKLTKSDIITKFVPVLNHEKLGYELTTVVGIELRSGLVSDVFDITSYEENILAAYDVTGQFDAIVITKFKNTNELNNFIKELLKEDIIIKTYTQTVLSIAKEEINSSTEIINK